MGEAACAEKEEELRRLELASDQRDLRRTKVKELEEEVARVEAEAARLELGLLRGLDNAERPGTARSQATSAGRFSSRADTDVECRRADHVRADHVPVKVGSRIAGPSPTNSERVNEIQPGQLSPGRRVLGLMIPRLVTIANGVQARVERAKCSIQ